MECHARREARSHCPIHVQDKWCVHLLAVCDRCHTTCSFTVGKNRKNVQFLRDFYFAKTFLSDFFVWWFGHLSQENHLWSIIVSSDHVHCLLNSKEKIQTHLISWEYLLLNYLDYVFFVNFKPIVHNLYLTRDNDKRGMRARPEDKTIDHR